MEQDNKYIILGKQKKELVLTIAKKASIRKVV